MAASVNGALVPQSVPARRKHPSPDVLAIGKFPNGRSSPGRFGPFYIIRAAKKKIMGNKILLERSSLITMPLCNGNILTQKPGVNMPSIESDFRAL